MKYTRQSGEAPAAPFGHARGLGLGHVKRLCNTPGQGLLSLRQDQRCNDITMEIWNEEGEALFFYRSIVISFLSLFFAELPQTFEPHEREVMEGIDWFRQGGPLPDKRKLF